MEAWGEFGGGVTAKVEMGERMRKKAWWGEVAGRRGAGTAEHFPSGTTQRLLIL